MHHNAYYIILIVLNISSYNVYYCIITTFFNNIKEHCTS